MMSTIPTRVIAAVLACAFTGCGVHSAHPLGEPENRFADEQLIGVWRLRTPDQESAAIYLHIGRSAGGLLRCVTVHHSDGGVMPPVSTAEIGTTVIGDSKIANLSFETGAARERYTFARYEVDRRELRLYTMRTRPVAKAIEAGEVEGKVRSRRYVVLAADSTELVNFVADADHEELFGASTKLVFERIDAQVAVSGR